MQLRVIGKAIPSEVYLVSGGRRYKMTASVLGEFSYLFPKLQKPVDFRFEAAGFGSDSYQIALIERPSLLSFSANLVYPAYLGKANERWENIGNLVVPEGTQIQWQFRVNQSDKLQIIFNEGKDTVLARKKKPAFLNTTDKSTAHKATKCACTIATAPTKKKLAISSM
ncbi:MAG: hypothetical protein HC913_14970 [Microscillaceae bacterium]|nr:hypothetical protein [Microscillaceae bacterium]